MANDSGWPKPTKVQRGLMNEYPCGCQVRHDGAGCYTICGCPMHNAAPALLEACQAFHELFNDSDMRPEDECHELYEKVSEALALATPAVSKE